MKRLFFYSALLFCALNLASCDQVEDLGDLDGTGDGTNTEEPTIPEITVGAGESELTFTSDAQNVFIDIEANTPVVWDVEVVAINEGDDITWLTDAILNPKVTSGIGLSFQLPQNDLFTFQKDVEDEYGDVSDVYTYYDRSAKLIFTTEDEAAQSVEVTIIQSKFEAATLAITIPEKDALSGEMVDKEYSVSAADITDDAKTTICTLYVTGDEQTINIPITTNDKNWTADIVAGLNKDLSRVSIAPKKGANGDELAVTLLDNNDSENYTGFDVVIKAQEATIKMAISQAPLPKMPTEVILWGGDGVYEYGDEGMVTIDDNSTIDFTSHYPENAMQFQAVTWNLKINGAGGSVVMKYYDNDGNDYDPYDPYSGWNASEENGDLFGIQVSGSGTSYTMSLKPFFQNTTKEARQMKIEFYYNTGEAEQLIYTTTAVQAPMPEPTAPTEFNFSYTYTDMDTYQSVTVDCTEGFEIDLSDKDVWKSYTAKHDGFGGTIAGKVYDMDGNQLTVGTWGEIDGIDWVEVNVGMNGIQISPIKNNSTGVKRSIKLELYYVIDGEYSAALRTVYLIQGAEAIQGGDETGGFGM